MEFNGMFFDKALANKHAAELSSELVEIEEFVRQVMQDAGIDEPNTSSPLQIGLVLFGGVLQYDGTETLLDEAGEPLVFKTGKRKGEVRTRKVKLQRSIEGLFPSKGERTPKGSWKVDDASLKKLPKHPFVNNLMSLRTLNKDISTYYVGYSNLVWHDGRIHQSLNHCATATGRLSCTKPNLQNVTSSE
jgi:DNA polymerase I-like protein with 3'-5' exonuclease and polymerase domains